MTAAAGSDPGHLQQDSDLLGRARQGDAAAFEAIVQAYQGPVYRAALAVLGSPADAEEAAQDAFVAAFRHLDGFRAESSLKTWLVAIAWRKALTRRRRLQFLRFRTAAPADLDRPDPMENVADPEPGPQDAALANELRGHARRMVRSLPARLRDPLLLVAAGEHSYDEVAAILRLPVGTVKWRVSEARRVLRGKLRGLGLNR